MIKKIKNWFDRRTTLALACQWWENLSSEKKINLYYSFGGLKR